MMDEMKDSVESQDGHRSDATPESAFVVILAGRPAFVVRGKDPKNVKEPPRLVGTVPDIGAQPLFPALNS
jgi:hypothetical protein